MVAVDTLSLLDNFQEVDREGDQKTLPWWSPLNYIEVFECGMHNSYPEYQKGRARVHIDPTDLMVDLPTLIKLFHTTSGGEALQTLYQDDGPTPPTSNIPTVAVQTPVYKYLSGVGFFNIGSTFLLSFVITNFANKTFTEYPAKVDGGFFAFPDFSIRYDASDELYHLVSNIPIASDLFSISNRVVTISQTYQRILEGKIGAKGCDPHGEQSFQYSSVATKLLIDTFPANSTNLYDVFRDEVYRLPSSYTFDAIPGALPKNLFPSNSVLGAGDLQVYNGALRYPSINFASGYLPVGPNYSGAVGDRTYYRFFYIASPKSSGTLKVSGITLADLGVNVEVDIKLPTQTAWLYLSNPYDDAEDKQSDGHGCRVGASGDTFQWSVGTISTLNSGYYIWVRVTVKAAGSKPAITRLSEEAW